MASLPLAPTFATDRTPSTHRPEGGRPQAQYARHVKRRRSVGEDDAWRSVRNGTAAAGQKVLIKTCGRAVGHLRRAVRTRKGHTSSAPIDGKIQEFLRQLGVDQPIAYKKLASRTSLYESMLSLTLGGEIQEVRGRKRCGKGAFSFLWSDQRQRNQRPGTASAPSFSETPRRQAPCLDREDHRLGKCKVFVDTVAAGEARAPRR